MQIANEGSNGVNLPTQKDAEILLINEHGFILDNVKYLIQDADQAQALTRSPDILGDFPELHLEVSTAFLILSPGADINGTPFAGNGPVVVVPEADVFGGVPISGFPEYRASPWYLNYNIEALPWIYHDEHGWQFIDAGSTEEVIFLYDLDLADWLFVNEANYRFFYLFSDNPGFIFSFDDNVSGRRFFQRADNGEIFSRPEGLPTN